MAIERTSPNRDRLIATARRLGPLRDDMVFVGGQITELLITDTASVRVRPTVDVDVIVSATTRSEYARLEQQLSTRGFLPDRTPGSPVCRFCTSDNLVLDAMPVSEQILGFSNVWYPLAIETSEADLLDVDLLIRRPTAPAYLATKWAAFHSRGADEPRFSNDLEDIILLTAGRASLVAECAQLPDNARAFIATSSRDLLRNPLCEEIVLASLPDAARLPGLVNRVLERLALCSDL